MDVKSQDPMDKLAPFQGIQVYARRDDRGRPTTVSAIDEDHDKIRALADLLQTVGYGVHRERNPRAGRVYYRLNATWVGHGDPPARSRCRGLTRALGLRAVSRGWRAACSGPRRRGTAHALQAEWASSASLPSPHAIPMSQAEISHESIQYATEGFGPLLQRDYWGIFRGVQKSPPEISEAVRAHFADFSPRETATFRCCSDSSGPLSIGDEMDIKIALLGWCKVRVVDVTECSLTLRTLAGTPRGRADHVRFVPRRRRPTRLPHPQPDPSGWLPQVRGLLADRQAAPIAMLDSVHPPAGGDAGWLGGWSGPRLDREDARPPLGLGCGRYPHFLLRRGTLRWPCGASAEAGPTPR